MDEVNPSNTFRILHVVEATFAGVGRHVLDLAGFQAAAGHEVTVAFGTVRESEAFRVEREELTSVSWVSLDVDRRPGLTDLSAVRQCRRIARERRIDVIHGHSTKGGLLARTAAVGLDARIAYTPNAMYSMNPMQSPTANKAVGLLEKLLAKTTDVIVAVSPEERSHMEQLGLDARIVTVPNGISPFEPSDKAEVRRELQLPPDGLIFGFVGRLDDQKSPLDLVAAFDGIAREYPEAHFAIVGDGPLRERTEQAVAEADELVGRCSVLGVQPGTWAMAAFDVFVMASRYEGFPYVLLEAAYLGLPIVTTDGACASLLIDGPGAVYTSPVGDIAQLVDNAKSAVESLGRSAVDRRFTASQMTERTTLAYEGL